MPTKQDAGRIETAKAVAAMPIHIAWGAGQASWDTTPPTEPTNATALVAELGRRVATEVGYVVPDAAGTIETPQGNYTRSNIPTRWVLVRVNFAFADAPTARIRELAVFVGTQIKAGLPAGQRYFAPADITNPGQMYLLDRSQNFLRNAGTQQAFDYVLPF